ncbi:hypothetical protein SUGI_0577480 [Cryptomeria japonica]|uniref:uncharacterized protein LOC131035782 n=1 Tax=Cryptomeria japonica TaxID=3369 RepID=UPI002408D5B2|nr:uncharacterized protein LOC131035782 [Cryptomeria japonica]GLJ29286.1 hypothetical protein SUGI_0577480 [Cryptomeria japonica]
MDVNRTLGVNSGSGRRADRSGSAIRRRATQRVVDLKFEPEIEWVNTADASVLVLELPGFKKEDVKVDFDGGEHFTVSGENIIEDHGYVGGISQPRQKICSKFKRVFRIPTDVENSGITSRFENETMYITFNKLKAPPIVKSIEVLEQVSKSMPQVGESSGKFIEESSEKKDDKASSNKLDQILKDGNVGTPNVPKSSTTQDEKALSNKMDQIPKDEKVETPTVVKSSATQDDKASSNKLDQSPRDEKVETLGGAKSTTTQNDKVSSNKLDQSPRDEKVENLGGAKSTTTQDDKSSSNKLDQISRDVMVETPGGAKSTTTPDEKALSNKLDQSLRDEIVETIDVAKSSATQDEKVSNNKPNQIPRDEKVQTPEATKFISAQPDDEKVGTPKVVSSNTTQETIQTEIQSEASNKLEELAKHPSLLDEEKLFDSNTLPNQFDSFDSKREEAKMKVGDQHEQNLDKNPIVESTPHQDQKQEEKVSSPKAKKAGDSFDCSQMKADKWEKEKQSILKACTYVSQFISSRREPTIVASIVAFSLGLYITYKFTYSKD